jgi:hypothetical protein
MAQCRLILSASALNAMTAASAQAAPVITLGLAGVLVIRRGKDRLS